MSCPAGPPVEQPAQKLRAAAIFRRLGLDSTHSVDRRAFERGLQRHDPDQWQDRSLVRRLLRSIDANGDGIIQLEELCAWLDRTDDHWQVERESSVFATTVEDSTRERGATEEEGNAARCVLKDVYRKTGGYSDVEEADTTCPEAEPQQGESHQSLEPLEKSWSSLVFRRLDLNRDGIIDMDEFREALCSLDDDNWDDQHRVARLFRAIDTNGDGKIQPEEMHAWLNTHGDQWDEARESVAFAEPQEHNAALPAEAMANRGTQIFQRLDLKSDGVVDGDEFRDALRALDEDNWDDNHRVGRLFKAIDTDGDGLIQLEELCAWLQLDGDRWDEARESIAFAWAEQPRTDGVRDTKERQAVGSEQQMSDEASVRAAEVFQRLDAGCDGVVDCEEFTSALLDLDEEGWNMRTTARLFAAIDTDSDGLVQYSELCDWLRSSGDQWDEARKSAAFASRQRPEAEPAAVRDKERVTVRHKTDIGRDYALDEVPIGQGSFGAVRRGVHNMTQVARAIKEVQQSESNLEELEREIEILSSLDHPHVVRLCEVYEDRRAVFFVLELCPGGELLQRILGASSFSEREAAAVMRQIAAGVRYLHANFICHRDLKLENFLLRDKGPIETCIVKIIDFGIASRFVPGHPMTSREGTVFYIAPEVLQGSYDELCDIWSCGVVMYMMLSGYPPFNGSTDAEVIENVQAGSLQFHKEYWAHISADAKDLIKWQLQYNSRHRCSAQQVLGHVWIRDQAPAASRRSLKAEQMSKMRRFCQQNNLKKAALRVIAREVEEKQLQNLKETFQSLDKNGDGKVTFEELEAGVASLSEQSMNLRELMHGLDTDSSGSIDYTEFLAAALTKQQYEQERACWTAFHVFDRDGSGTIDGAELMQVLQSIGVKTTDSTAVTRVLAECDADNDGQISFKEFFNMMRNR